MKELDPSKTVVSKIGFILINSGKTPALNTVFHCAINTIPVQGRNLPTESAYTFEYPGETPGGPTGSRSAIQPNMTLRISPQNKPTEDQASAIRTGTALGYMYGLVTYDDIFKVGHRTRFCVYFEPDLSDAHSCPVYNDAD